MRYQGHKKLSPDISFESFSLFMHNSDTILTIFSFIQVSRLPDSDSQDCLPHTWSGVRTMPVPHR